MASVFITVSSEGLGLMAGQLLAQGGHRVVLHARNEARARDTWAAMPAAQAVLTGDVSTLAGMREVAAQANTLDRFDGVIHNVGLGYREPRRVETADGFSQLWAVNVLAPYVLTALIRKPRRLVYLGSGMHLGGDASFNDPQWTQRRWNGAQAYSDTKLQDLCLALGVARRWPDIPTNAVSPGWVATRMGGTGASDDLDQAHITQVWLATSDDLEAISSGGFYYHHQPARGHPAARDTALQDRLLTYCREVSGVNLT